MKICCGPFPVPNGQEFATRRHCDSPGGGVPLSDETRTRNARSVQTVARHIDSCLKIFQPFFQSQHFRKCLNTMLCNRRSHKNNGRHSEVINKHKLDPGRSNLCNRNRGDPGASECLITHDDNLLGKWTHKQQ